MDRASEGNRTLVPSLEGWCTSRCTTPARQLATLLRMTSQQKVIKMNNYIPIRGMYATGIEPVLSPLR